MGSARILRLVTALLIGLLVVAGIRLARDAGAFPGGARRGAPLEAIRGEGRGLRVLFVGNSFTHANDLPELVRRLAEAAGEERPLLAAQETPGGCTFQGHLENGVVANLLETARWDFVVLQEQSLIPSLPRGQRAGIMDPYARRLIEQVRAAKGGPILFMTWGYKAGDRNDVPDDSYTGMQERLRRSYTEIAESLSVAVAPVGTAWEAALGARPNLELWAADGIHPSVKGSYLAACVFYALLYRKDPTGNAFTAGLDADEARFLQQVAQKSVN